MPEPFRLKNREVNGPEYPEYPPLQLRAPLSLDWQNDNQQERCYYRLQSQL